MTTPHRRLVAIDDPLAVDTPTARAPRQPRQPARQTAALYVELPVEQADALARAAFELRTHKRRIVTALIAEYVDPRTEAGRSRIAGLLEAHRDQCR